MSLLKKIYNKYMCIPSREDVLLLEKEELITEYRKLIEWKKNYLERNPPLLVGDKEYFESGRIFELNRQIVETQYKLKEVEKELLSIRYWKIL